MTRSFFITLVHAEYVKRSEMYFGYHMDAVVPIVPKYANNFLISHNKCFLGWISSIIKERLTTFKCPTFGCTKMLDVDIEVLPYLHEDLRKLYERNLTNEALKSMGDFMYCPKPGCENGFLIDPQTSFVKCTQCDTLACLSCKDVLHVGMSCSDFRQQNHLTEDYKKKNTKPCPQCKVPIEKGPGCLHMSCTYEGIFVSVDPYRRCRYQFCWECLEKYQDGHIRIKHPTPRRIAPTPAPINTTISSRKRTLNSVVSSPPVIPLAKRRINGI